VSDEGMSDDARRYRARYVEQRVKFRQALVSNEAYRVELQQLKADVAELVKAAHQMLEDLDSREPVTEMMPAKAKAFRRLVAVVEPFTPWRSVNED